MCGGGVLGNPLMPVRPARRDVGWAYKPKHLTLHIDAQLRRHGFLSVKR